VLVFAAAFHTGSAKIVAVREKQFPSNSSASSALSFSTICDARPHLAI